MLPVGSYLVWEGSLHGDLHGVITEGGRGDGPLVYVPND